MKVLKSLHYQTIEVHILFIVYSMAYSAPSIFHAAVTPIFDILKDVIAYFDDCFVYGKTKEEYEDNLIKALEQFQKHNIKVNKNKMKFFIRKIKFLGCIISENDIEKDPEKVRIIQETPPPKNINELQSFLGLV